MKSSTPVCNLAPPLAVIELALQVMGQIDLDAWASPHSALATSAASGYDHTALSVDEICRMDWQPGGDGRVLVPVPSGTANGRRLANKALREYRKGRIREALLWIGSSEALTTIPWIWDHLVLIPWRRLRPLAWHDELQEFYAVSPGSWSFIGYLPPLESRDQRMARIARFHVCAAPYGRVITDENAGDSDWQDAYATTFKAPYSLI